MIKKIKTKPGVFFYISVFCTYVFSPTAKAFDCVKNAQEVGKTILCLEMFKDFIKDVTKGIVGIKNEIVEVKKQKEVLDKIKKQNEEIIKLLNAK